MDEKNKLYFGDNLKILREYVENASVDLIYLDLPVNSSPSAFVRGGERSRTAPPTTCSSRKRAARNRQRSARDEPKAAPRRPHLP